MLRDIQCQLDSETITPLPNLDHGATESIGESENDDPNTHTEEWLVQARLRLAALRSATNTEVICSADDAERVALSAGRVVPIREPVRVPLSDQLSTGRNSEKIAEMVLENRNLISVSLGGRVFRALVDSRAMVSLVGAEIARICKERIVPSSTIVRGVNGRALRVIGKLILMLEIDGHAKPLELRAIEGIDHQMILGIDFCEIWHLEIKFAERLWRVREGEYREFAGRSADSAPIIMECAGISRTSDLEREQITRLLESIVPPPAAMLGHTNLIKHQIEVESARPVRCAPRRMSPRMLEIAQEEVRRMFSG